MESAHGNYLVCPACDLVSEASGTLFSKCLCPRCHAVLRVTHMDFAAGAALAFSALIFLIAALAQPFMSIESYGITSKISLVSIFTSLKFDWTVLIWVFLYVTFVCPGIILCQLVAIGWLRWRPGRIGAGIYAACHDFCMVDVFLLGVAVSLVKLTGMAEVDFYGGFYCGIVCTFILMGCLLRFPPQRIWDLVKTESLTGLVPGATALSQGVKKCRNCGFAFHASSEKSICPRCKSAVYARNHQWLQKNLALLLAALILFLPANLYPIMVTQFMGVSTASNIVEGAIELWHMESYFVSIVILFASLLIPTFKIAMLIILIRSVRSGSRFDCRVLSRSYRIVEFVGKWSMVDVFVVLLMSSIVQIGGLVNIFPGFAVVCFCFVVITTLFAAENFDERLIWDRNTKQ